LPNRDFHPARNIELLGALPLKVTELLTWYTFPCILIVTYYLSRKDVNMILEEFVIG
jgi:hypothetical protein